MILLTGAKMRSPTEFVIHTGETLKAVIDSDVIKAIPWDDNFSVEVVQEMLLPMLDNTSIVGYCVYVSYTLNVFRMPLEYERKRN